MTQEKKDQATETSQSESKKNDDLKSKSQEKKLKRKSVVEKEPLSDSALPKLKRTTAVSTSHLQQLIRNIDPPHQESRIRASEAARLFSSVFMPPPQPRPSRRSRFLQPATAHSPEKLDVVEADPKASDLCPQ